MTDEPPPCHTPGATTYCPVCRTDFACGSCGHVWDTTGQRRTCMQSHLAPDFPEFDEIAALKRERRKGRGWDA